MNTPPLPRNIHAALIAAMNDISRIGIAKTKTADAGGAKYRFRGIEDAMNEMSPILVRNGITVTPRYSELQIIERAKAEVGKATRFVTIKGCFKFAAEDGSFVEGEAYGEAMDSGDKATTKAQSVAFRTALFQQFIVPFLAMDPEDGDEGQQPAPTEALAAANKGMKAYEAYFKSLAPDRRKALLPHHDELKAIAAEVDGATA